MPAKAFVITAILCPFRRTKADCSQANGNLVYNFPSTGTLPFLWTENPFQSANNFSPTKNQFISGDFHRIFSIPTFLRSELNVLRVFLKYSISIQHGVGAYEKLKLIVNNKTRKYAANVWPSISGIIPTTYPILQLDGTSYASGPEEFLFESFPMLMGKSSYSIAWDLHRNNLYLDTERKQLTFEIIWQGFVLKTRIKCGFDRIIWFTYVITFKLKILCGILFWIKKN